MKAKKKIIALVAVVALASVLCVCLTACNMDDYWERLEHFGFEVEPYEYADEIADQVEWGLHAHRDEGTANHVHVTLVKFKKTSLARDYKKYLENSPYLSVNKYVCKRNGKLVYWGSESAVESVTFLWGL